VLRHRKFFGLGELNAAIRQLLLKLNDRPFKKMPGSRSELFRSLDVPALLALPSNPYEYAECFDAGVNIDYCVRIDDDDHYYSVPHHLVNQRVQVRLTARTVEMFFKGNRVSVHPRSSRRGKSSILNEHRPKAHQKHLQWTPSRIVKWAAKTGPKCAEAVDCIMKSKPHPEQGYRSCLGLTRLAKAYGPERMEAACTRALALQICSYHSIKSMLKKGLESQPLPDAPAPPPRRNDPSCIRGADYYRQTGGSDNAL